MALRTRSDGRKASDRAPSGAVAVVLAVATAACASGNAAGPVDTFDRLYESGDWVGAAAVFESDSMLRTDERALYRAGTLYARAGTEVYDAGKARAALDRLLEVYPGSEWAPFATVLRGLVGEAERQAELVTSLRTRVERLEEATLPPGAMARYRTGIALADPSADRFDPAGARQALEPLIRMYPDTEHARTAAIVLELVDELRRSAETAAALRRQLDQLRDVDLRPTTPPPPPPPPR